MENYTIILGIVAGFAIMISYFMANNKIVLKWKKHLGIHKKICDNLTSDLTDIPPAKLSQLETIRYIIGFIYYHEFLVGREGLMGIRPVLVGIWIYLFTPITFLSLIILAILLFSSNSFSAYIGIFQFIMTAIHSVIIFVLDRYEIKYGDPIGYSDLIEKIGEKICETSNHSTTG
ncbi:MAG: hypothetical protein ACFFD2_11755 [Promethearchaeota archaeon]